MDSTFSIGRRETSSTERDGPEVPIASPGTISSAGILASSITGIRAMSNSNPKTSGLVLR